VFERDLYIWTMAVVQIYSGKAIFLCIIAEFGSLLRVDDAIIPLDSGIRQVPCRNRS
jgi:hypothetical protein